MATSGDQDETILTMTTIEKDGVWRMMTREEIGDGSRMIAKTEMRMKDQDEMVNTADVIDVIAVVKACDGGAARASDQGMVIMGHTIGDIR